MKAPQFDYVRPATLHDAFAVLQQHGESARILAGGQSLVPMLNLRLVRPSLIVDISAIAELRAWDNAGGSLHLGGRVTHAMAEDGRIPDMHKGYLAHVAAGIAYRAVRNRGTMAGSLSHADPAADWPTALAAADAELVVGSARGTRAIPSIEFAKGPFSTDLAADELVTSIRIPARSEDMRWTYQKQARKAGEFALSIVAIMLDRPSGYARVAIGGLSGGPVLLRGAARTLLSAGKKADLDRCDMDWAYQVLAAETTSCDSIRMRIHAATLCRAMRGIW